MKIIIVCLMGILACSSCRDTDNYVSGDSDYKMTRHDEIRKIMRGNWIHDFETQDEMYWSSAEEHRKVLIELSKMKKDYYYESSEPNIPDIPGPAWVIEGPLTIGQVEQESFERIRTSSRSDVPQVPFGFENDKWNKLKSQYKDGDEFYFFSLDPRNSPSYYGTSGYVLIRDNQIVGLK